MANQYEAPGIDVTMAQRQAGGASVALSSFLTVREGQSLVFRRNSGADVGARPRANFIEGSNITISMVDDPVNNEVDITITATAAAPTTAQFVTLATDAALTNERVLTGTANQVILTDGGAGAAVTLSTPQNIHTGATPTFLGVRVSEVSPAQITADQNDYNPGTGEFFRLASDAARTITGLLAVASGRMFLTNVGSNNIVLANQNAGSAAANRIITGTGADVTLAVDDTAILLYDSTTARWRLFT